MATTEDFNQENKESSRECRGSARNMQLRNKPYVDDMSMFLAWQNWYLMQQCQTMQAAHFQSMCYQSQTIRRRDFPPQSVMGSSSASSSNGNRQPQPGGVPSPFQNNGSNGAANVAGCIVSVASYQTRVAAEIIDFLVLLILKVLIVMIFFGDSYIEQFQYILIIDENTNIEDLEWVLLQAMLFRAIVIVYEAFMCCEKINKPLGGATIGKAVMGLQVVSCDVMAEGQAENQHLHIIPGEKIGFRRSLLRALMKNVAMSFFFPLLFPFMLFKHNRLIYDAVVGTIVVKSTPENQ